MKNRIISYQKLINFVAVFLIVIGIYSCTNQDQEVKEIKKIRFVTVPSMVEIASYIAYYNKYFEEEGLDIDLLFTSSGNISFEKLLNGEVDIITVTETPVVHKSFTRNDFYIIGELVGSIEHQIIARKDAGIKSVADLKGKRIAVMQGTSADYFLDSFLIYNGLSRSDIELVNLPTVEMPAAIEKGEVDVISCWQPFALNIQKLLGDNGLTMPSKNIHTVSWLIVVMKSYARKNPEAISRFLKALVRAEKFLKENRSESIRIHAEISKSDLEVVDALFNTTNYKLSLEHRLLLNLENQARWVIKHNYTDHQKVPNYLDIIYADGLKEVKPKAVTVIMGGAK